MSVTGAALGTLRSVNQPSAAFGRHASRVKRTTSQQNPQRRPEPSMTALYFQASPITIGTSTADDRQKADVWKNC